MNTFRLSIVCFAFAALAPSAHAQEGLAPVKDNGFVSPTHEKMVGKIVFAKTAVAVTTPEKPGEYVDALDLADAIWFRAYLPRSLENAFRAQGTECRKNDVFRVWDIAVDGKRVVSEKEDFYAEKMSPESFEKSTSIRFEQPLNGKPTPGEKSIWGAFQSRVAPLLSPGTHKIELSVYGRCDDKKNKTITLAKPEAKGEISVKVSAAAAVNVLPKPGMKDDKLASEMKELMKKQWPQDEILKVVIKDASWTVQKHKKSGKALSRTIATAVAVKQQGQKCRVFDVEFIQPSPNGVTFGKTEYNSVGNNDVVACQALQ